MWPISAATPNAPRCSSPFEHDATADAGADGDAAGCPSTSSPAPKVNSPQAAALASFSITTGQPDALLEVAPQRLVAPGQVGREQHGRPRLESTKPAAPTPDRGDVVGRPRSSRDQLLDGRARWRRCRSPATRAGRVARICALLVDDAAGDLGAADVDADRESPSVVLPLVVVVEVDLLHGARPRCVAPVGHRCGEHARCGLHQRGRRRGQVLARPRGWCSRTAEMTWHTGQ